MKQMPRVEKLDVNNCIECQRIKTFLSRGDHPALKEFFNMMIVICNQKLNTDALSIRVIESDEEVEDDPELSDHSSDESEENVA